MKKKARPSLPSTSVESKRVRFPYSLKKSLESFYFQYCIKQGKLPVPDIIYYHWDKKRITKALL